MEGPDEWHLDLAAMRAALLPRVYSDEELDLADYVSDDDPEMDDSYSDAIRAQLIIEVCTADEFATLIDRGLIGLRNDFSSEGYGVRPPTNVHLLEHVMPDEGKMRVCLERSHCDVDSSDWEADCGCGGNDKLSRYIHESGGSATVEGIKLILNAADYNLVYDATLAAARCSGMHVRSPQAFDLLERLEYAGTRGTDDAPVGFGRACSLLATTFRRHRLTAAFTDWLESSGVFSPNGVGGKRARREYDADKDTQAGDIALPPAVRRR